jgi:hypothetical protein
MGQPLTMAALQPIWTEALTRWQEAGATPEQLSRLARVTVEIAPLAPGILAMNGTGGNHIWISPDADDYGWFTDPTPGNDAEFLDQSGGPAPNQMDLLSVVAHEMGHVILWLLESPKPDDVMTEALPAGVRRMPTPQDLGLQPWAEWVSSHNALGLKELVASAAPQPTANGVQASAPTDLAANLGLLDRVFASALGTSQSLGAPPALAAGASPVAATATTREDVAALPDRPPATRSGAPYQVIHPQGTVGSVDSLLGDALLDELARDLAS